MTKSQTEPGLRRDLGVADADALYAAIIEAHAGLSHEESVALNAHLVLVLANHIGDMAVLQEAIQAARRAMSKPD